jgi:hypothetical protein
MARQRSRFEDAPQTPALPRNRSENPQDEREDRVRRGLTNTIAKRVFVVFELVEWIGERLDLLHLVVNYRDVLRLIHMYVIHKMREQSV